MKINYQANSNRQTAAGQRSVRRALTLIELLFAMAIITVLSSLAVSVLLEAQDDAQTAATRSRIAQIEAIMQTVLEDYEVRRLPFSNQDLLAYVQANSIQDGGGNAIPAGIQLRNLRRRILLDLLKSEFPPAFVDANDALISNPDLGVFPTEQPLLILDTPVDPVIQQPFETWLDAQYGNIPGGFSNVLSAFLSSRRTAEVQFWGGQPAAINLPGEYLYVQLSRVNIDGSSGLELLGPNAVGDTDGDNVLEIVDAFGDSMGLVFLQADVVSVDTMTDRWEFQSATDWERRDPVDGLPVGYQVASSTVPSLINDLRIQVVSETLNARGE